MVTVTMRDEFLRPRGQLRCTKISMVLRKNQPASYTLTVSSEDLSKSRRVQKGWGLIIEEDGLTVSGPITAFQESSDKGIIERSLSGLSDLVFIRDRITYPDPSTEAESQSKSYYTYKGPAETAIKNLVSYNAGSDALPARKVFGLKVAATLGRGGGVVINTRLKNLLDEIRSAADTGGLVITCGQASTGQKIVFDVAPGRDRSRQVRLTVGADEVLSYETIQAHPEATTVVVGGQGEGAARTLQEVSQPNGWGGRRVELFKDRRDTDDNADLVKEAEAELSDKDQKIKLSFELQESPYRKLGKHFYVGDTVTVELEHGKSFVEQVTSAQVEWSKNIRAVKLTVGNTDDDQVTSAEQKKIALLSSQVMHLQAI